MIGVLGQYYFDFGLGGKEFIPEDHFESFYLYEEAGNVLPRYKLSFSTGDETILNQLNEGNFFTMAFGKDYRHREGEVIGAFVILKVNLGRDGQNLRKVVLRGTTTAIPYVNNAYCAITKRISAFEAIAEKAAWNFTVDVDPIQSLDRQVWVQPGISDRNWIQEMWLHSKLQGAQKPDCGLIAITFDNKSLSRCSP